MSKRSWCELLGLARKRAARRFYESLDGTVVAEKIIELDMNIERAALAYGWRDLTVLARISKARRLKNRA
jgi:hypothetical protein